MANNILENLIALCERPRMTPFAKWLDSDAETQSAFARKIGISRSYLSEIASGKKRPSLALAFKIESATEGAIPASSWVSEAA